MPRGGRRGGGDRGGSHRGGGEDRGRDGAPAVRPFWSGTISFGLVAVPVNLYAGVRSRRVSLRMLDEGGTPLARRYWCPEHEREVDSDEIVRGYETDDGKFVVVTDEELEALAPEKTRDIDLTRFVPVEDVDPRFFQRTYFLTPSGDSTKAYRLLASVMERTGRAGIATFVIRGKEYLVAILAQGGVLRAETLRFADEVRTPETVGLPEPVKVTKAAVKRFAAAIDELAEDELDRSELTDIGAEELLELVERKREQGEEVVVTAPANVEAIGEHVDLMEVIKASLRAAGGGTGGGGQGAGDRAGQRAEAPPRRPPRRAGKASEPALQEQTKDQLYDRARELDIPGRSSMTKDELIRAIRRESA
ncbi:MAG TPA: Ku protein [Thermoanaerobaculia bacterium]|nr:Ku protein [Thermoanaerobaculia bacterium]